MTHGQYFRRDGLRSRVWEPLFLLSFSLFPFLLFGQPGNDDPCNADDISINSGCVSGGNTGASTNGYTGSCWADGNEDGSVWFSFTANNDSLNINTDFAAQDLDDSQLAIYASDDNTCTGNFTEVGCDEDGGETCALCAQTLVTGLTVGDTYFVQVDGYGGQEGEFCISVNEPLSDPPDFGSSCELAHQMYPHDACWDGAGNGNIGIGDDMGSSGSIDQSCSGANDANECGYWTTFTANDNNTTIDPVEFNGPETSNYFDITVFSGSCGSLTEEDCRSVSSKNNAYSIPTTSGETYYVFMTPGSNYSGCIMRMSICSSVSCTAPSNDACANAISMNSGTVYNGTNACASADQNLCSGSTENNVWYEWTAPASWPPDSSAFFTLFDQDCFNNDPTTTSDGMQVSIYQGGITCGDAPGAGDCIVYTNPQDDNNFYAEFQAQPNTTYLINLDGFGGDACSFKLQINSSPQVLPVELLFFDAVARGDKVELNWSTATEEENDFFEVQRSRDASSYAPIDRVPGNGTSSERHDYRIFDEDPLNGVAYYRLKQVDRDGAYEYSDPVAVDLRKEGRLKLYPNPVQDELRLEWSEGLDGEGRVRIFDAFGRLVLEEKVGPSEARSHRISMAGQRSGVYFLEFRADNERLVQSFIKEEE